MGLTGLRPNFSVYLDYRLPKKAGNCTHTIMAGTALIDESRLEARRDNATGRRQSNLITRRNVLLYLIETTNYVPSDYVDRITALFENLNTSALNRIIAAATKRRETIF